MANIIDYIEEYGNKSFEEEKFNEIDNVIFSSLSYINFDGILSSNKEYLTIYEAGDIFFKKYAAKELKNNIFSVLSAIKVFKAIYKKNRYKNIKLYNYIYKGDHTKQFSAVFIDINKELTYVSFEGTDELVSGWKEDGKLAYQFPVPAHIEAIKYTNFNIMPFSKRKYIFGGHSKGGNIALVAGMFANPIIKKKILNIYMNDAPGLKTEQLNSHKYRSIKKRLIRIIPNYSIIGLMLCHDIEPVVILTNKKGPLAHNIIYWQTENDSFIRTKLSRFSQKLDIGLTDWLKSYNDKEREEFVEDLFDVLNRANISSLLEIKASAITSVNRILKESKKITPKSKKMISELVRFFVKFVKEESSSFIKSKIHK